MRTAYYGTTLQNPEFQEIRDGFKITDRAVTAKAALAKLRKSKKYSDLPGWSTIDGTKRTLVEWERDHTEECGRMKDDGQFFGFKQVAEGYLGQFTRRLFIPAVCVALSDAAEGRGSVFSELMDLVVRRALARCIVS